MIGFVNILKPTGLTSSDVVSKVKGILYREFKTKIKVGHLGTLDPGASGVLPIAVGKATKLFNLLIDKQKVYRAAITFGKSTDTIDSYGKIIEQNNNYPKLNEFENIIKNFIGTIQQIPPKYSAINIDGKRAYELARSGKEFVIKSKKVTINDIYNIRQIEDNTIVFDVKCMGGTYIRSLVRDIADSLNCLGYMSYLIRIQSGNFKVSDSITLEEFEKDIKILPCEYMLKEYPRYDIDTEYKDRLLNGVKLKLNDLPKGHFLVYLEDKLFSIAHEQNNTLVTDIRLL